MGTLTIGLSGSGVVNGQKQWTIDDADVTRWINAYREELHMPEASNAQVLSAWADDMIRATKEHVKMREARTQQPPDIVVTPA